MSSLTSLDRELQAVYKGNIFAMDNGQPQRTTSTSFRLLIQDENDNVPVFPQAMYAFKLPSDAAIGSEIGHLTATDADEGQNADLR